MTRLTNLLFEDPDVVLHQELLVRLPRLRGRGEALVRSTKHQTITRSHGTVSEDHHYHLQLVFGQKGLEPEELKSLGADQKQSWT